MSATWDSKGVKAVPVSADEVLIIDTEDGRNQKRATLATIPFGTTSNVGTGEGLALPSVVADFPFKSLIGTAPIVLTGNANDVTFDLNALTNSDLAVGVFSNITGIGTQTQALDMGGNNITNLGTIDSGNITIDGFIDLSSITIPADPATTVGRAYVRGIDANNEGLFVKIKQAGAIVEVQLT